MDTEQMKKSVTQISDEEWTARNVEAARHFISKITDVRSFDRQSPMNMLTSELNARFKPIQRKRIAHWIVAQQDLELDRLNVSTFEISLVEALGRIQRACARENARPAKLRQAAIECVTQFLQAPENYPTPPPYAEFLKLQSKVADVPFFYGRFEERIRNLLPPCIEIRTEFAEMIQSKPTATAKGFTPTASETEFARYLREYTRFKCEEEGLVSDFIKAAYYHFVATR